VFAYFDGICRKKFSCGLLEIMAEYSQHTVQETLNWFFNQDDEKVEAQVQLITAMKPGTPSPFGSRMIPRI